MNLPYLLPRLIRHFLPMKAMRWVMRRGFVQPGLETRAPQQAVQRYSQHLHNHSHTLEGKRVMVFGYGGSFALACHLLKAGAVQVILCEWEEFLDHPGNRKLLPEFAEYLVVSGETVLPRAPYIDLLHGDICTLTGAIQPVDVVLSNSVFEHLDKVEDITQALVKLTRPDGIQLHFIDLQDHFFKYPFEMLCYSQETWQKWLNPTSNLNRYRLWDYQKVFEQHFSILAIDILERREAPFLKVRSRIRPEFLSGDIHTDAAASIALFAEHRI